MFCKVLNLQSETVISCLWSTVQAKEVDGSKKIVLDRANRLEIQTISYDFCLLFWVIEVFFEFSRLISTSWLEFKVWHVTCRWRHSDQPMRILSDNMTSIFFNLIGRGYAISKWWRNLKFYFKAIKERGEVEAELMIKRPQWSPKCLKIFLEGTIEDTESFKNFYLSKRLQSTKVNFHFWQLSEKR